MSELHNIHNAETNDSSYDHVLKYTGILGGVQGLKMLLNVIRVKLTSKILGVIGIGLIGVYTSVFEFLITASNMGIPINATRLMSELFEDGTDEAIRHQVMIIRTWTLWTAILSVLVCLIFSPIISYFFCDNDWHRWPEVMLTAPVAVSYIIAEGECSILKGLRQLRKVAFIEASAAIATLLLTVPTYFLLGIKGVILGLILSGLATAVLHFFFSLRLVSYRVKIASRRTFIEGLPLIKVGIPFVLAGVSNAVLAMALLAIIKAGNDVTDLGEFKAGWQIVVGYACLAFVALESDFFPRLSSVNHNSRRMSEAINQQIDVCVLIIAPMLIVMVLFMPFVVGMLYTSEFTQTATMAILGIYYAFFRSISLPMGYAVLAKGDAILYFVYEFSYDVLFALGVWFGFTHYGLNGVGIAMSIGSLYDIVMYFLINHYRYGCTLNATTVFHCLIQFVLLTMAVVFAFVYGVVSRYIFGGLVFIVSLSLSVLWLYRNSEAARRLISLLKKKLK